jgi:hypothetical protein
LCSSCGNRQGNTLTVSMAPWNCKPARDPEPGPLTGCDSPDRSRAYVGRDLALAGTEGVGIGRGNVDPHGDRPLLARRLLLMDDPLGRHHQLAAAGNDRETASRPGSPRSCATDVDLRVLATLGEAQGWPAYLVHPGERLCPGLTHLLRPPASAPAGPAKCAVFGMPAARVTLYSVFAAALAARCAAACSLSIR